MNESIQEYIFQRLTSSNIKYKPEPISSLDWLEEADQFKVLSDTEIVIEDSRKKFQSIIDYSFTSQSYFYLHDKGFIGGSKLHHLLKNDMFIKFFIGVSGGQVWLPIMPTYGIYAPLKIEDTDELGNRKILGYHPEPAELGSNFTIDTTKQLTITWINSKHIRDEIRKIAASYLSLMYDYTLFHHPNPSELPLTYQNYADDYCRIFGGMSIEVIKSLVDVKMPAL